VPADFDSSVAELGASVLRNMRNAAARFNGRPAVDAIFRNRSEVAGLGLSGVYARTPRVTCAMADVADVIRGDAVEIECSAAIAPFYTVREREPDDLHARLATFVLEPAAP